MSRDIISEIADHIPQEYKQRVLSILKVLVKTELGHQFVVSMWVEHVQPMVKQGDDWSDILTFIRKVTDKLDYQNFLREVAYTRIATLPDLRTSGG